MQNPGNGTNRASGSRPVERLADLLHLAPDELAGLPDLTAEMITEQLDQLLHSSRLDELTGALRRGPIARALTREVARAHRHKAALTVALVDLDHLKEVNDNYGHAAGDAALKALVDAFGQRLRPYDLIGRWGGDEFVCALPDCREDLARQILQSIGQEFEHLTGCSFSAGLVQVGDQTDIDEILARADHDLYVRKRHRLSPDEREPANLRGLRIAPRQDRAARTVRAAHRAPARSGADKT